MDEKQTGDFAILVDGTSIEGVTQVADSASVELEEEVTQFLAASSDHTEWH